jgi:NitT/TauT family transport system substrate-binding protein
VEVAGQGATPDYILRKILMQHGLRPDHDVRLSFSLAPPEIAQSLIANRISVGFIPEPFATMALAGKPDLTVVSDIQDEWQRITGTNNFPMTVLAVNRDFITQNPQAFAIILSAFEDSINWTINNPVEAGLLAEKHALGFPSAVSGAAIPRSNYVFIPAMEARPALESLFRVFLDFSPESIGGIMPANDFYLDTRAFLNR